MARSLGRHPVDPISVHYTSPEAGYGPVVAGDDSKFNAPGRARASRISSSIDDSASAVLVRTTPAPYVLTADARSSD